MILLKAAYRARLIVTFYARYAEVLAPLSYLNLLY